MSAPRMQRCQRTGGQTIIYSPYAQGVSGE